MGHEREDFQTLSGEKIAEESRVARHNQVKSAVLARKQLPVLMYKDVYLNTADLNSLLPSVVVTL